MSGVLVSLRVSWCCFWGWTVDVVVVVVVDVEVADGDMVTSCVVYLVTGVTVTWRSRLDGEQKAKE